MHDYCMYTHGGNGVLLGISYQLHIRDIMLVA